MVKEASGEKKSRFDTFLMVYFVVVVVIRITLGFSVCSWIKKKKRSLSLSLSLHISYSYSFREKKKKMQDQRTLKSLSPPLALSRSVSDVSTSSNLSTQSSPTPPRST